MALECELKYLDVDLDDVSRRLASAGGVWQGRYFESNLVFDYADRSLKKKGVLLRLRKKGEKAVLTVKHPPKQAVPSTLKVVEELESGVDDFIAVRNALEVIGFSVAFAYEKVREKWVYMNCTICLDHLPFGDYVEIEGNDETVSACAEALGLADNATSTSTYHDLNIENQSSKGEDCDESFVFPDDERIVLQKHFGKV